MKVKIVTTMSEKYWAATGQYTVGHWKENLPEGWEIWLHDTPHIPIPYNKRLELARCSNPHSNLSAKHEFWEEAENFTKGITPPPGYMKEWKRFSHKSFAQWETALEDMSGIMVWMDADVKIRKPLNKEILLKCLDGKFCGYFGRDRVNTKDPAYKKEYRHYERLTIEGCFIIYNLDHPIAKKFFNMFKNTYLSMELFKYIDWCDTGAFELTKSKFPQEYFNDITGHLPAVPSPLTISILDEYLEHWMGTINKRERADVVGQKEKEMLKQRGTI
jgi:hypothetical protein